MLLLVDKQLQLLLQEQRHKLMQDFFGNVAVLGEVLGYHTRNDSQEIFENSIRKLTLKLNNTSLLFNSLFYEAEDEGKFCKKLQEDLKETCTLFQNGLFQLKSAFENEDLRTPFEFYLEILNNPLAENPKKLNLKPRLKKTPIMDKNVADYVEKKINDFLSNYAKADINLEASLKKILSEDKLETKSELREIISNSLGEMKEKSTFVPKNDLKGLLSDMNFYVETKRDNSFNKKIMTIRKWIKNKSLDPKNGYYLFKKINNFRIKYKKAKNLYNRLMCKRVMIMIRKYQKIKENTKMDIESLL